MELLNPQHNYTQIITACKPSYTVIRWSTGFNASVFHSISYFFVCPHDCALYSMTSLWYSECMCVSPSMGLPWVDPTCRQTVAAGGEQTGHSVETADPSECQSG